MPQLGDVFINTVYSENPNKKVKATDHPIEKGLNITDHVEREPRTMDITGVITGPDASLRKVKIEQYMDKGAILKYTYRNVWSSCIVIDFKTTHDGDVKGAFKFSMTLKEMRIAKTSVLSKPKQTSKVGNKGQQQPKGTKPAKVYVVVRGDNLSKIGAKYGISWQTLYNKNKKVVGSNPNLIFPGQRLVIPT